MRSRFARTAPAAFRFNRRSRRMRGIVSLFAVFAMFVSPSARADNAVPSVSRPLPDANGPALSEQEALVRLRKENLAIQAARFELSAARADVIAAGVFYNPALSVGGHFLTHGALAGGAEDVSIVLSQVVPLAGQIGLREDAARGFANAAERDFAAFAWDMASRVRAAYVDLQLAQARFRIIDGAVADFDRVEAIVSARATAGAIAPYDQLRVGVERSKLLGELAKVRADLVAARIALARSIGPNVDATTLVAAEMIREPNGAARDRAGVVALALRRRAEIAAAELRIRASDTHVEATKRRYVPSPDLAIGYSRWFGVAPQAGTDSGGAIYAGVSMPLPFFDRGQGTIDRTRAEAQAARLRSRDVATSVRREAEEAIATFTVRVDAWTRFRNANSGSSERLRQVAELAYREGKSTILELLDAYSAYVTLREQGLELQSAALRAEVELERVIGPDPASNTQPL